MGILKKILKVVIVLAGLFLLITLIAVKMINTIDWSRRSAFVERTIEGLTDFEVDELKDFKIHLGRSIRISSGSIALKGEDKDQGGLQALQLREVSIRLASWPLLKGDAIVEDLTLKNGLMAVRMSGSGKDGDEVYSQWGHLVRFLPSILLQSTDIQDLSIAVIHNSPEPLNLDVKRLHVRESEDPGRIRLTLDGALGLLPIKAAGVWGSRELFAQKELPFPFGFRLFMVQEGKLRRGAGAGAGANVSVSGQTNERRDKTEMKIRVQIPEPDALAAALQLPLGELPAFDLRAELTQDAREVRFANILMTMGQTRMEGDAQLTLQKKPPFLSGKFRMSPIDPKDFKGLVRLLLTPPNSTQFFTRYHLPILPLGNLDADLEIQPMPSDPLEAALAIHKIKARAVLVGGRLTVKPFSFALGRKDGSGNISGTWTLSAPHDRYESRLNLDIRRIPVEEIMASVAMEVPLFKQKISEVLKGSVLGSIDLKSRGRSFHELFASSDGKLQFAIENGKLSTAASKVFGFDLGAAVRALFEEKPYSDMECMISSFAGKDGVFTSRALVFATPDAAIQGRGYVDFGKERVDMTLEAKSRKLRIGTVAAPLHVTGTFRDLSFELGEKGKAGEAEESEGERGLGEALADALPFVEPGSKDDGACQKYLATLRDIRRASGTEQKRPGEQSVGR